MKPRNLLIAAVLLAALSGVVWWAQKHPESGSAASNSATVKLVDIPSDQLQQITVKKKDGSQIALKRESGKWQIISPQALPADQDAVGSMTAALSPLNADSVVEDKASDTAKYGLNTPVCWTVEWENRSSGVWRRSTGGFARIRGARQ